jgi:hypothetical protein
LRTGLERNYAAARVCALLLSARIQDAVWRRQVLVGYTPMGGDGKQKRDGHDGVAHAPAINAAAAERKPRRGPSRPARKITHEIL